MPIKSVSATSCAPFGAYSDERANRGAQRACVEGTSEEPWAPS